MFTGIVEEVGTVRAAQQARLTVSAQRVLEGARLGDSIAVNGACLTLTELLGESFSVDVMPETLRRTNLGSLRPGDMVNLERALQVGGRMGGHFVQGHIDGTGRVLSLIPEGDAIIMRVSAPTEIMRYQVEKGFIALDGVSLTVVRCDAISFQVSLVVYTQKNTTLGSKKPGDMVNLEIDIIAKYVERLREGTGVTMEFLGEHGFLSP